MRWAALCSVSASLAKPLRKKAGAIWAAIWQAMQDYMNIRILVLVPISKQLEHAIGERNTVVASKDDKNFIPLTSEEMEGITAQAVAPIICEGDAIGSVSLLSREPKAKMGDMEVKLVTTAAGFLGRQMEG